MLPNGLHAVGNGVSLLPWRKMIGVRWTGPAAPKPMTGTPSETSMMTGKSGGSAVPTGPPGTRARVSPAATAAVATRARDRCTVWSDFGSFVIASSSREGSDVPHLRLVPQPATLHRSRRESHYAAGRAREPYDFDLRVSTCSDRLPCSAADGVSEW